jgi:hypothetical protein
MHARYLRAKCELEAERYVVDSSKGLIHAYTDDMNRKIVAQLEGVITNLHVLDASLCPHKVKLLPVSQNVESLDIPDVPGDAR